MVALAIFLAIVVILEGAIIGEVLRMAKNAKFIFEIDDHDSEDVKFKLTADDDVKPGRVYFIKVVRK